MLYYVKIKQCKKCMPLLQYRKIIDLQSEIRDGRYHYYVTIIYHKNHHGLIIHQRRHRPSDSNKNVHLIYR